VAPDEGEKGIRRSISPSRKGGKGDLSYLLPRHCEERSDVAISFSFFIMMKG